MEVHLEHLTMVSLFSLILYLVKIPTDHLDIKANSMLGFFKIWKI